MLLAPTLGFMFAYTVQCHIHFQSQRIKRLGMERNIIFGNFLNANTAHTAHRIRKIVINKFCPQPDCLKNLRSLVRLDRRDPHLRSNLNDPMDGRVIIIIDRSIIIFMQKPGIDQLPDRLMCQIRIDRTCPIPQQGRKMMHFPWLPGFQDHSHRSSFFRADQMLLQAGDCQQGRDCHMVLIHFPVREDQNIGSLPDRPVDFNKQIFHRLFQTGILIIGNRNLCHLKTFHLHILDLQNIRIGQDGVMHLQHLTIFFFLLQKVSVFPYINRCRCHYFLTDRINRRVRHLGKPLFKIAEQWLVFLGKHCQRHINSHSRNPFSSIFRHI